MSEIWKNIEGYEGKYQVSNTGKVKSLDRYIKNKNYKSRLMKGKTLKQCKDGRGYYRVCISLNGTQKTEKVHRLVAKAFVKNIHCKPTVNHKNTIKTDNNAENLEWATHKENIKHAYENGIYKRGENHFKSKLKDNELNEIKYLYKNKIYTKKEISLIYKITYRYVNRVLSNEIGNIRGLL